MEWAVRPFRAGTGVVRPPRLTWGRSPPGQASPAARGKPGTGDSQPSRFPAGSGTSESSLLAHVPESSPRPLSHVSGLHPRDPLATSGSGSSPGNYRANCISWRSVIIPNLGAAFLERKKNPLSVSYERTQHGHVPLCSPLDMSAPCPSGASTSSAHEHAQRGHTPPQGGARAGLPVFTRPPGAVAAAAPRPGHAAAPSGSLRG